MRTYHIRKPLKPYRGNQYYRDYNDRSDGTYCGAEMTEWDICWDDKPGELGDHVPCKACIAAREASDTGRRERTMRRDGRA